MTDKYIIGGPGNGITVSDDGRVLTFDRSRKFSVFALPPHAYDTLRDVLHAHNVKGDVNIDAIAAELVERLSV